MIKNPLSINIRKRTIFEWLILWIVLFPLLWGTFFDLLHFPGIVKYTVDVVWFVLFLSMSVRKKAALQKKVFPLFLLIVSFLLFSLILYLLNYQSFLYFLWGVRNNFRYYVFFFAIVYFFSNRDVKTVLSLFDITFWINIVVVLMQYFLLGYRQDYLGGIFGVAHGCNAYMIIFLSIVVGYSLLRYMNKVESAVWCFSKCGVSLLIAAFAEMKVFFALFVLILLLCSFFTSFSWKKVLLFFVAALFLFFGSSLLANIFNMENSVLSFEYLWKLATQEHYSDSETVNRLSAIPTLSRLILTEPVERIFGLGLGNCDTSTFDFLNTPFYQQYSYLRYSWFSCARLFLEVGYVGVVFYLSFFVICAVLIWRRMKAGKADPLICQLGIIVSILCVIMTFYNSALHMEAGYMAYLFLALPFVSSPREGVSLRQNRNRALLTGVETEGSESH